MLSFWLREGFRGRSVSLLWSPFVGSSPSSLWDCGGLCFRFGSEKGLEADL